MRATGALGGAGEERLARLQAAAVEQLVPGGQHGRAGRDGGRLGGGHVGRVDAGAVPAAQLVELGVHGGERLQPELDAEGVGQPVEHAVVGQRVRDERLRERARAALPRDERAGLLGRRRDGQHDVRPLGHLGVPDLERDEERARGRAPRGRSPGRAGRPARGRRRRGRRGGRRARRRGSRWSSGRARRAGARRPRRRRGRRGRRSRRPGGRRAAATAAGRPRPRTARPRGAAPRRAGRRCAAASRSGRGEPAGHAGQPLPDEDERRRRRRAASAASARASSAPMPSSTSASVPGAAGSSVPDRRCRPRLSSAATDSTRVLRETTESRSRRNAMPASSSASRPTSSTAGARSRSANVTSSVRPATWWPRKVSSSAECGRARPSTSLVPSATRANLPYA